MQKSRPHDLEDQRAAALTVAALECAQKLGLSAADTAVVLGIQPGAVAAMKKGERAVDGVSGEAERADALLRVTQRLKALLGDAETTWRSWIRRENDELGSKPLDIMKQRDGVLKIAAHLQSKRGLDAKGN